MRFKIDEHLPVEIKELLTHHQHDAVTVADEDMGGAVDPDVAQDPGLQRGRTATTV